MSRDIQYLYFIVIFREYLLKPRATESNISDFSTVAVTNSSTV